MSDNTLERLVYLIKCWYICRKKERVCTVSYTHLRAHET